MRTKLLLSAAVLGVAGIVAASAQVYSVNVVGYINVAVPPGFSMIANQLDNSGNNTLAALLPTVPEGTTIYKFRPAMGDYDISGFEFGEWSQAGMTLNPGEGAFIFNPGTAAFNALFVGEVKQGALSTPLVAGFQIVASQVPQTGALDADLGFPAAEGDIVYQFNNATGDYKIGGFEFGEWSVVPTPAVGEAFFVNKAAGTSWTRNFTVQ
jgi:hypothetical protein